MLYNAWSLTGVLASARRRKKPPRAENGYYGALQIVTQSSCPHIFRAKLLATWSPMAIHGGGDTWNLITDDLPASAINKRCRVDPIPNKGRHKSYGRMAKSFANLKSRKDFRGFLPEVFFGGRHQVHNAELGLQDDRRPAFPPKG